MGDRLSQAPRPSHPPQPAALELPSWGAARMILADEGGANVQVWTAACGEVLPGLESWMGSFDNFSTRIHHGDKWEKKTF